MCRKEIFTFTSCEHRLPSEDVEECGRVRHGNLPQCDPVEDEEIPMGDKCHECLEADFARNREQEDADDDAEMQRILQESLQTSEAEQGREPRISDGEQEMLERALRESAEAEQPQPREADFDEEELQKIMELSLQTEQPGASQGDFDDEELQKIMELAMQTHGEESNKPKYYLRQRLRYECGHETDIGPTDIEFDPESEGLPYIQHDDRGQCPDCGGSASRATGGRTAAVPAPILGFPEPMPVGSERHGVDEGFGGFEDDLIDLEPEGRGKGWRSTTPLPEWTSADDYTGDRPDDAHAAGGSEEPAAGGTNESSLEENTHPDPEALRQHRIQAFDQQSSRPQKHAPTIQPSEIEEFSDSDTEAPEMPPYATVDNLALQGLLGEDREKAEREERNRVERLRLEGTLARRDSGDMSDPAPLRD